jgi:integrase
MLTPSAVTNAKAQAKPYKLADERGMYLLVRPDGARWWRFDYRRPGTGKRNTLSLGTFPDVSLRKARERRDAARKLLADGIDPGDKRKAERDAGAETFEAIAREWFAKHAPGWAPGHAGKIIRRLERDVFPWIGSKPIANLTAPDLLAVLRRIESRGAVETAHRAHQNCGQVFRYAIATGRATTDPAPSLRGALTPWKGGHFASITEPDKVGELLRAIDGYSGGFPVACALKLAPLVFVRPGELRAAEWKDFDLEAAEWRYHVTNTDADHIVPLATQAVTILRALYPLTGSGRFLFPGMAKRDKPLSNMALNSALRRLGYGHGVFTAHGFRAMARTILDEQLGFRPDFIEHQLAHAVKDPNGTAYNRTKHLPERRKMMQAWADYLDGLRTAPGRVVPIRNRAG